MKGVLWEIIGNGPAAVEMCNSSRRNAFDN